MEDIFKVIFQLEADSKQAVSELDKVNSKYKETNENLKKQQSELTRLMAREAELIAGRAKSNNPTAVAKYNIELLKTSDQIKKLNTEITALTKTEQGATTGAKQFGEQLTKAFDATKAAGLHNELKKVESENKKLAASSKDAFGTLRAELRQAKAELIEAFGRGNQQEIQKASEKVGHIKDEMNDLNAQVNAFAGGTKFEQVGNIFRNLGHSILNLNFKQANEQSKSLLATTKSITFAEASKGIKDLGGTLANVGKSLLANPLFLLGAAITLLISVMPDIIEHFGLFTSEVERNAKALREMKLAMEGANAAIDTQIIKLEDHIKKLVAQNAPLKEIIKSYKELEGLKFKQVNNEIGQLVLEQEKLTQKLNKKTGAGAGEGFIGAFKNPFGMSAKEKEELNTQLKENETKLTELNNKRLSMQIETEEKITTITKTRADERKKLREKHEEELFQQAIKNGEAMDEQELRRKQKELQEEKDFRDAIEQQDKADEEAVKESMKEREARIETESQWEKDAQSKRIAENLKTLEEIEKDEKAAEEARRARIQQRLTDIQTIANATINAAQTALNAEIKKVDQAKALQEKRVENARAIADKGNAKFLEMEQDRLEDLNKKREAFVRRQQQLATLELIANTAIAVSKAAAQGGVAAGVTIAATLIALVGGLIQAREIASSQFYEGGYTGDGDPKSESKKLGKKNYTYHKGEFVFDHQKTARYKDIFEDIHRGNIDLADWQKKVVAYETVKMMGGPSVAQAMDLAVLEGKLDKVIAAIAGQTTSVSLNENGLEMRFKKIRTRSEFIKGIARA